MDEDEREKVDISFVATTYGHWEEEKKPYIVSVRFTLEELDAAVACGSE